MKIDRYAIQFSVFISICGVLVPRGALLADGGVPLGGTQKQILIALDYRNPMKLNLDPVDIDSLVNPDEPQNKKYDYYKSKPEQEWAERYHLNPGIQKMINKDYEGAYREFEFVLRFIPNHPRALSLLGDMAIVTSRPEKADGYFKTAFEMYPDTVRASNHKDYGRFLYLSRNYEGAIQALKKSVEMDPKMSEAHYYLGLTYFAIKDFTSANYHAQKVYSRGFPLTELKEKLIKVNGWNSNASPGERKSSNAARSGTTPTK